MLKIVWQNSYFFSLLKILCLYIRLIKTVETRTHSVKGGEILSTRGGCVYIKLFGQCQYRTNTFHKRAFLINSPNSSAVWELRAMPKFHESSKQAREKNSPCLIISSEAEIGQGELDGPTCLDSPPGQVIIQATCTKTTNIYRGHVPSLPSVFKRKH